MAWFPCKIGGGSSEIANILKGTSNPVSALGDNGQLYLKYGLDTRYTYDETLGGYVLNDYFYSEANQTIGTVGGRVYYKNSNGAAIAVIWKNSSYSGPLLISTVESNITYSYNTSGSLGSATIDGITWYLSTTNYWSNPVQDSVAPIVEADYYPTVSSRVQDAIEDILEASDFKTSLPTTSVIDSFAKVNNQWQGLIGTDIDDIDYTGRGSSGEIKTLVYTLEAGGQWETFQNPAPDNGTLLYEVTDSNGNMVLSVKKKISDLPIYNAYVALGVFDTSKTINAARSSDNSTIYLSVNTTFTGYSLKAYTFEPGFGNATVKRGSFVSASTQYGIVDVNCGFKPDLVLVSIPFGNNDTTSYWEKNVSWAGTKAIWNLYPAEHSVYVNDLGRATGETGIQQINDDGFSFMSNGANTRGIACEYIAVKYETDGESVIEDYVTNYFPCLLYNNYSTIFSKASNDEIYNGGRGGTRASSNPVFYFCCKTTNGYWGYGLVGLASASVQITSTTSYGGAEYYTQTTTDGNTVYLARLGAMNNGQTNDVFKNGYFEIDIDGSQYVEQDGSTWLFDQIFVDAAYEALTALS